MKKISFIIALLGIAIMAQANSINCSFSQSGNNGYSCDLSKASFVVPTGYVISSCTISFSSNYGFQNCNLFGGNNNSCNLLSDFNKNNCTLDSSALSCLNNYLFSDCNLNLDCSSKFNGKCTITYTCTKKTTGVPEVASTAALLAFGLLAMIFVRRQLVPVKK